MSLASTMNELKSRREKKCKKCRCNHNLILHFLCNDQSIKNCEQQFFSLLWIFFCFFSFYRGRFRLVFVFIESRRTLNQFVNYMSARMWNDDCRESENRDTQWEKNFECADRPTLRFFSSVSWAVNPPVWAIWASSLRLMVSSESPVTVRG